MKRIINFIKSKFLSKKNKQTPFYWKLIEKVWDKISIYDGEKLFHKEFDKAPKEIGNLFATYWVVSEVLNGALPQLFYNNTGILVPEAILGFEAIGLPDASKVLAKATKVFGDNYPRDRTKRVEIIEKSWVWGSDMDEKAEKFLDHLLQLTDEFYDAVGRNEEIYEKYADLYAKQYLDSN